MNKCLLTTLARFGMTCLDAVEAANPAAQVTILEGGESSLNFVGWVAH